MRSPGRNASRILMLGLFLVLVLSLSSLARGDGNLLQNPTFAGAEEIIPPPGWSLYGSLANGHRISVVNVEDPERRALLIEDLNDIAAHEGEIGLSQTIDAGPGRYRGTFRVGPFDGTDPVGPFLQIRFLPANVSVTVRVTPFDADGFRDFVVEGEAPEGTNQVRVYIYTPNKHLQSFQLQSIRLERIDESL